MGAGYVCGIDPDAEGTRWDSCRTCKGTIGYIDAPTGGWWAHVNHPKDHHEAIPIHDLAHKSDRELLIMSLDWLLGLEDKGPRGEGWQSDKLEAFIAEIERRRVRESGDPDEVWVDAATKRIIADEPWSSDTGDSDSTALLGPE